ncbi:hypothetical protein BCR36DRAFT_352923, partial [Piromyces finnis]
MIQKIKKLSFLFYTVLCSLCTVKAKKKITICLRDLDIYTSSSKNWYFDYDKYKSALNGYFTEKVKDNEKLKDYEIDFYFYHYEPMANGYSTVAFNYMNFLSKKLKEKNYDMAIVDDRTLFSEMSLIESDWVRTNVGYRYPSLELFHDLSKYIDMKVLEFHDPKSLSYGIYEKKLIGIPYENDFNVFYYRHEKLYSKAYNDTQELINNMESYTWDDLTEKLKNNEQPQTIPTREADDLLNFFVEYTSNKFNLSPDYDPDHMKLFYNNTSTSLYVELRDFIKSYIKYQEEIYNYNLYSAFNDYMKGDSTFFKARASYNFIFKKLKYNNADLPMTPLPKHQSVTNHKLLVANKYSDIKPEILAEIALILTDKKIQLLRADEFGCIPTFDFTKKDSDEDMQTYCNDNPVICSIMEKTKKLYIRDIFKSKYMVPFYEILCLLPLKIKTFFEKRDIDNLKLTFQNMNELITSDMGLYGVLSIFITVLTIVFCFFVIFMTYRLRDHPYIKVISPVFCNLIVGGCVLNMIKLLKYIPSYSIAKIKIFVVIEALGTNLIYIPMFAVAYRIYRIFKTKSFMSNKLDNKRLFFSIMIAISIAVIYKVVIIFTCKFFYEAIGSNGYSRIPVGEYSNYQSLNKVYQAYLGFVFIALIFMIIATGSRSSKFGDVCYTFVIFCTNISDYLVNELIKKLDGKNYPQYFFLTILFNCFLHFICVYVLIGSRIHLLMNNPEFDTGGTNSTTDATQYVALRSKLRCMSIMSGSRFTTNSNTRGSISQASTAYSAKTTSVDVRGNR